MKTGYEAHATHVEKYFKIIISMYSIISVTYANDTAWIRRGGVLRAMVILVRKRISDLS